MSKELPGRKGRAARAICRTKVRHATRTDADRALEVVRSFRDWNYRDRAPFEIYLCPVCAGYHLASGDVEKARRAARPYKVNRTDYTEEGTTMSADKKLTAAELSEEDKRSIARMMVAEKVEAERVAKYGPSYMEMLTDSEWERIRTLRDAHAGKCPACKKGRLVMTVFHGNLGDSVNVACRGEEGCKWKEHVSDPL